MGLTVKRLKRSLAKKLLKTKMSFWLSVYKILCFPCPYNNHSLCNLTCNTSWSLFLVCVTVDKLAWPVSQIQETWVAFQSYYTLCMSLWHLDQPWKQDFRFLKIIDNLCVHEFMWEVKWPLGYCMHLQMEQSGFEPWPGRLCCVLVQDFHSASPPRCIKRFW